MQIYKIKNLINSKIYIGKDTTSNPDYYGSGLLIKRSIIKYGKENFTKEIIDETSDYNDLSKKEIFWIDKYNSTDRKIGYNISKGGDGGNVYLNHPDLDLIKEKISKGSPKKGKTYEEAFGKEKAKEYKINLSKSNKKHTLGKKYEDLYSYEISEKIKKVISINTKKSWTEFRKKQQSNFAKINIYNSLLSKSAIKKNKEYLNKRWNNWRESEKLFINYLITSSDINGMIYYLSKIPNSLFKNRSEFYEFIGSENHNLMKGELIERKNINSKCNKKKIIIDNIEYESISNAVKKLNIYRSLISYRLRSTNFKNYLYLDNTLNIKYNKFINIDPYLSKKSKISIDGKKYESIAYATKCLNKTQYYISWRLNSKSYPNWFYLDKLVELKQTGVPKIKPVSVNGVVYESISKAANISGIDRQIIRYRLKRDSYTHYFYI